MAEELLHMPDVGDAGQEMRGAGALLFVAGRSPTGWSAGVEISCRIYKPRRARALGRSTPAVASL